ncbi:MAG: phytanoyl-CoA dioxygenase family protein [Pirellulales bacterium]
MPTSTESQPHHSTHQASSGSTIDPVGLLADYDRTGYVALRGFLSSEEVTALHTNVARYISDIVPTLPREQVFYEKMGANETLKQLQRMHNYDEYFHQFFTKGKFPALAGTLLRDEVVPINLQYFNKPAGVGQPTPPHQDGYYFMLKPCEALTMWLALDDVDEENGCVRYVAGSHRRGIRPHGRTQTLGFSQAITDFPQPSDEADEIAFPAKPGDLLVHHALTIHRAEGNRSSHRSRRALGFIYYAKRAEVDEAAQAEYQARLNQELITAGKL